MDLQSKFIWLEDSQLVFNLYSSSHWYPVLYQIAFFSGLCVFVFYGIRQKYPLSSWLIISATAAFLLVAGSKLGTFSLQDWQLFFRTGQLAATGNKTALGAAILITVFLGFVVKAIKFKAPFWGAFAFFLPVMMLVQRAGCMMAGCCYGKPSAAIGGVKYFGPSIIRNHQIDGNLIPITEPTTLPVHNVPLYLMVVALLTILVLLIAQRKLKDGRQLVLISVTSMLVGRFIVEFFRDLQAHTIQQKIFFGLTQQQWFLVVMFFVFVYLFRLTLRKSANDQIPAVKPQVFPMRNLMALLALAVSILILKDWFTAYEKYVLYFQITLAGILNIKVVWTIEKQLKPLVAPLTLFAATAFVMAQEVPDSTAEKTFKKKTYITTSFSRNQLHGTAYPCIDVQTRTGCSGEPTPYCALADSASIHGPGYSSFQLGIEQNLFVGKKDHSFSVGLDFAGEAYSNRETNFRKNYYHYSLYGKLDLPLLGMTFGFRNGEFFMPNEIFNKGVVHWMPRLGIRFGGNQNWVRLSLGVFDEYLPGGINPASFNINANFRLINNKNTMVRPGYTMGTASSGFGNATFYGLNTDVYFKRLDLMIRPTVGFTSYGSGQEMSERLPQFAITLRKGF